MTPARFAAAVLATYQPEDLSDPAMKARVESLVQLLADVAESADATRGDSVDRNEQRRLLREASWFDDAGAALEKGLKSRS